MGHPTDEAMGPERAARDRLWRRRDAMEARLKPLSLSIFTFAEFADLQLIADRSAPSDRAHDLEKALERMELFLKSRDDQARGKPRLPP